MLFLELHRATRPVHSARHVRSIPALFILEIPLQHSFAARRLATVGSLIAAALALACYQEKPPQSARDARTTSALRSNDSSAKLGLQAVPATHDTAIREIDEFQLTPERLQRWTATKHALDSLQTTHPEITAHLKAGGRPKSVDDAGMRFDAEPTIHTVLQRAGTSGKEFLLTSIALQQAMKGFQLKATGKLDPNKVPPAVLGNINFVGTHMSELMASMAGAMPQRRTP